MSPDPKPFPVLAVALPALLVVLTAATGCGPGAETARTTLLDYMEAVQADDADRLFCLSSGAAGAEELGADESSRREAFDAWLESWLATYEQGRDEGFVDPEADPLLLVKLFSLGKGTWFDVVSTRSGPDGRLIARTDLRFGYRAIDLSRFSPGTTLYLCGTPPGTVERVRVPVFSSEVDVTVLDTVTVDWTLVPGPGTGSCPAGWTVESASVVPDSATAVDLTWKF